MRLLCRLGIHKWGQWSNRWYKKYIMLDPWDFEWTEYRVHRSLKCSECNHQKDKFVETLTEVGSALKGTNQPTWD
ncbi:hypothetical protein [Xanthomonas phage X1]|nr:hypothetical protein [Xanthomonas phage X1]